MSKVVFLGNKLGRMTSRTIFSCKFIGACDAAFVLGSTPHTLGTPCLIASSKKKPDPHPISSRDEAFGDIFLASSKYLPYVLFKKLIWLP